MTTPQTFTQLLLGELSSSEWKFQILLLTIGIFLRVFNRIAKREDKAQKISFTYWINDFRNIANVIYSILLMYLIIRFFGEYEKSLHKFIPENIEPSINLMMVALGFFLHKISNWLNSLFRKLSKN